MNVQKDGGPAFPIPHGHGSPPFDGMALRDVFAAAALTGLFANAEARSWSIANLASIAYAAADEMLHARYAKFKSTGDV